MTNASNNGAKKAATYPDTGNGKVAEANNGRHMQTVVNGGPGTAGSELVDGWDSLPPAVTRELAKPLDPSLVSQRRGRAGRDYSYIEGHSVIDQANRIFGHGGWGFDLAGEVVLREIENVDPKTGEVRRIRAYSAPVRVAVPGAPPRTDVGFHVVAEETGEGHETAFKGCVTDGLKRALRSFGEQLGNSLYGDQPANGHRAAQNAGVGTAGVVDLIAQLIRVPSGYYYRNREVLRILDPCCGAGEAVAQLAERLSQPGSAPVETCGVELHRDRAEQAEGRLDRTLAADLFQTSIANGAFGLAFVNPPYDHDAEKKRTEHSFLVHCTRYLTESGLLVFIVPRRRLAVSARYLAAHYQRLRCWAFPDPERQVFDQVVLAGYRKMEPHLDEHAERQVREWAEGEPPALPAGTGGPSGREELYPSTYPELHAPTTPAGEVLFAPRTVDPTAAAVEARRSGLWTSTEITDSLWPSRSQNTRPLMPLRRGHMAMLTAAGFLDNLCLQADGHRILVKGRTTKEKVLAESTAETETYRERLRTTVVALDLGDGEITDIEA